MNPQCLNPTPPNTKQASVNLPELIEKRKSEIPTDGLFIPFSKRKCKVAANNKIETIRIRSGSALH